MESFSCFAFGKKKVVKLSEEEERNVRGKQPAAGGGASISTSVDPTTNSELILESSVPKDCSAFSCEELAAATNNFRAESVIGEGGFGTVYKGMIGSTGQVVAVKKFDPSGRQGNMEFVAEVLMLSLLQHPNLVDLIGYCAEEEQRLLVYDFLPLGSLENHLHDLTPDMQPLDWDTRMMIADGIAKGLDYLHNTAVPPVIHRDLKPSNILLGEGFHPKLSDFGLAKFGPTWNKSHVSTRLLGTPGYVAPEYYDTGKLTIKSDVYSYGIVLLELITGRRPLPLDSTPLWEREPLMEWLRPLLRKRKNYVQAADPRMEGRFLEPMLYRAMTVALMCANDDANSRPSMGDVVFAMNFLKSKNINSSAGAGADPGRGQPIIQNEGRSKS